MPPNSAERISVCLGFPAFHSEAHLDALRAIHPRVAPELLPIDPGGDWLSYAPSEPHAEPPPWGASTAVERREALARAEVLVSLHTPADLMQLAPCLRWVQACGAGVDGWVAAGVAADRVVVTNMSGLGARSISEFVLGRLLQVWKSFRAIDENQKTHTWTPSYGKTFAGTTMGIVGFGAIGEEVARRARAFGVRVLGMKRSYRPGMTSELADELFGPSDLRRVLGECDSVVLAAPHTPETEGMFDADTFAAMKPGAVFVNVARGPLVVTSDLVETMRSGHLGAAILDVFEEEPLPGSSPLWDLPNTYVSPHGAVSVDRYAEDAFEFFVENVRRYVAGEPLRNAVDMKALGFRSGNGSATRGPWQRRP